LGIDAQGGSVPENVLIRVVYGGGEETFQVGSETAHGVLLCEVHRHDADDDQSPIRDLTCDLWSSGAATVSVTAQGYMDHEQDLEAEIDPDCGLMLTEVSIKLAPKTE